MSLRLRSLLRHLRHQPYLNSLHQHHPSLYRPIWTHLAAHESRFHQLAVSVILATLVQDPSRAQVPIPAHLSLVLFRPDPAGTNHPYPLPP